MTARETVDDAIDNDPEIQSVARRALHALAAHVDRTFQAFTEWMERSETKSSSEIEEIWEEIGQQKKLILSMAMLAVTAVVGAAIRIMFFGS